MEPRTALHVLWEGRLFFNQAKRNHMCKLTAAALALVFTVTIASAQTPQPVQPAVPGGSQAQILTSLPGESMTITHWYKQNVYDPGDNKIGEIMDVLVDKEGKMVALIVGVGGFLGAGEKDVAVPFNSVQFKTKDNNKWW